jgi:sugar/nucleoside kinase (ribokinase family)
LPHDLGRHILTYPGTMAQMTVDDLDFDYLASARHFHLSSLYLQKALHPQLPDLFRKLKRAGLTISLDTNDDTENLWSGVLDDLLPCVDVLLPNESEAMRMTGCKDIHDSVEVLARKVPLIVVKCGSEGALVRHGNTQISVPAIHGTTVDTIGAGNATGALSTLRAGGVEAFCDQALWRSFLEQQRFPLG